MILFRPSCKYLDFSVCSLQYIVVAPFMSRLGPWTALNNTISLKSRYDADDYFPNDLSAETKAKYEICDDKWANKTQPTSLALLGPEKASR
jgi:hypothetical protein